MHYSSISGNRQVDSTPEWAPPLLLLGCIWTRSRKFKWFAHNLHIMLAPQMMKFIPGISTVLFAIFISGLQYEANDEMVMLAIIFMSNVLFLIGFILIDRALPEKFLIKSKKTLALTLGIVTPIIVTLSFFTFDTEIDMMHLYVLDCVLYCFVVNISFIIQYRKHVSANKSLEEIR